MFREILVRLLNDVKGAQWAIVVAGDGVPVDASSEAGVLSAETLAAEYALFVRACQRVLAKTREASCKVSSCSPTAERLFWRR